MIPITEHIPQVLDQFVARPRPLVSRGAGHGRAIGHHGEILQGAFHDHHGELHRGLVTLPLPALVTTATFQPNPARSVTVRPAWKLKAKAAAELLLREFVPFVTGGDLEIVSDNHQPGLGMGSSTSDVIAALRAVADCYGLRLSPEEVARLAVTAEGASDSTMHQRVVLFAQRRGLVLEDLAAALPPMVVVGCDTDPRHAGVDTLSMRVPYYTPREVGMFRVLIGALRHALATGSAELLGRVTEASAVINQRLLPTPGFRALRRIARETTALGVQVSHSGTVAGILFHGGSRTPESRIRHCEKLLRDLGFVDIRGWEVHS